MKKIIGLICIHLIMSLPKFLEIFKESVEKPASISTGSNEAPFILEHHKSTRIQPHLA
jgi:hypothetical protein